MEKYATATSIVAITPSGQRAAEKGNASQLLHGKGKYLADAHPGASRSAEEPAQNKRLMATELFWDPAFHR